jgi:hypothetical protein
LRAGNSSKLRELPHPSPRYACDIFQKYQILKIGEGAKKKRFLVPRNDRGKGKTLSISPLHFHRIPKFFLENFIKGKKKLR